MPTGATGGGTGGGTGDRQVLPARVPVLITVPALALAGSYCPLGILLPHYMPDLALAGSIIALDTLPGPPARAALLDGIVPRLTANVACLGSNALLPCQLWPCFEETVVCLAMYARGWAGHWLCCLPGYHCRFTMHAYALAGSNQGNSQACNNMHVGLYLPHYYAGPHASAITITLPWQQASSHL